MRNQMIIAKLCINFHLGVKFKKGNRFHTFMNIQEFQRPYGPLRIVSSCGGLACFAHKTYGSFHIWVRTHQHVILFKDIVTFAQNKKFNYFHLIELTGNLEVFSQIFVDLLCIDKYIIIKTKRVLLHDYLEIFDMYLREGFKKRKEKEWNFPLSV